MLFCTIKENELVQSHLGALCNFMIYNYNFIVLKYALAYQSYTTNWFGALSRNTSSTSQKQCMSTGEDRKTKSKTKKNQSGPN